MGPHRFDHRGRCTYSLGQVQTFSYKYRTMRALPGLMKGIVERPSQPFHHGLQLNFDLAERGA